MKPIELLEQFIAFIPAFEARWYSDQNYHRADGGAFSLHGVCAEFSDCFRDSYGQLNDDSLKQLFDFIELHMVDQACPETTIDNALCTCFLENIASEPCGQSARPWMGPRTRAYFDRWHVGPPY